MEILRSASKLAFILITVTSCVAFLMNILNGKDFMVLASMAFSFYFTQKIPGETSNGATKGSG